VHLASRAPNGESLRELRLRSRNLWRQTPIPTSNGPRSTVSGVHGDVASLQIQAVVEQPVQLTEEVVRRHQQGLWRYVRFLGADRALAEDLVQDTFLQVLKARPLDHGDRAFAGWLRRTALNLYRNTGRQPRRGVVLDNALLEQFWREEVGDDSDAYVAALRECLTRLDPKSQLAIELRHCQAADRTAVAKALGMSVEGVKSVLRRARARLHACVTNKLESSP